MLFVTLLLPLLLGIQTETSPLEISEAEEARVVEQGRKAADKLMQDLKAALMGAVREGGPAHAVRFCSGKALELTDSVEESFDRLEIKRTTFRYRNPANAPDALERTALESYHQAKSEEESPRYLVQKFRKEGELRYRFYRPLRVAGLCLTCHGDPQENIPEEVARIVREEYPDDRATGYQSGDFRGLVRVEMTLPALH